jgi:hypothetical protein
MTRAVAPLRCVRSIRAFGGGPYQPFLNTSRVKSIGRAPSSGKIGVLARFRAMPSSVFRARGPGSLTPQLHHPPLLSSLRGRQKTPPDLHHASGSTPQQSSTCVAAVYAMQATGEGVNDNALYPFPRSKVERFASTTMPAASGARNNHDSSAQMKAARHDICLVANTQAASINPRTTTTTKIVVASCLRRSAAPGSSRIGSDLSTNHEESKERGSRGVILSPPRSPCPICVVPVPKALARWRRPMLG